MLIELAEKRGVVKASGEGVHVTVTLTEQGRAVATANTRGSSLDPTAAGQLADEHGSGTRSNAFVTLWKAANLGPFMTVRTAVYDAIDRQLENGPTTLKGLVSGAVKEVREAQAEQPEKFPWSRVTQFVETLMRRRPVALSGDERVSLTWTNGSLEVTAMVDEWQLVLDGELVLHLVDQGAQVRIDDMPDLAGALYGRRDKTDINRAYEVVRRLIQDGLIADGAPDDPLRQVPPTALRAPDAAPTARDLRIASEADARNA